MDKRRIYIFIALVLALVLIAVISLLITGSGIKDTSPSESAAATEPALTPDAVSPTAAEASDTPDVTVSLSPTEAAEASASPSPTPAPTPSSAPSAQPSASISRSISQSGSFESDTGTKLIMYLNWSLVSQNSETATVRVELVLSSYTLSLGQRSGSVTVAGVTKSFTSPSISYESELTRGSSSLASLSFDVTVPVGETTSIPVSASWNFNGVYGGTEISQVTAGGTISVQG